jgi:hypothetical protein
MSQFQQLPPDYFPPDLGYQPQMPHSDGYRRLNLVRVFTGVSLGLDVIHMVACAGLAVLMFVAPSAPPPPGPPAPALPMWLMGALYGGLSLLTLCCGILKLICLIKFRRLTPSGRKWMTTAGVVGCCQMVGASCCWLQVVAGIYTLVIINTERVRAYFDSFQKENPPPV